MFMSRYCSFVAAFVLGLALAALPLAIPGDGPGDQVAFAKDNGNGGGNGGGGGGNGGGKGGGRDNGKDGGNSGSKGADHGNAGKDAAAAASGRSADAPGQAKHAEAATTQHTETEAEAEIASPHPSKLGRLNAALNASPEALASAAPNSAVGTVAQAYREALAAYGAALAGSTETEDGEAVTDPALQAAAEALALAANKEITPDVVAAVNAHLAESYAEDPNLAGFADPTAPESREAAENIADLAQDIQEQETDQGLGNGLGVEADDGAADDGDETDDLADGTGGATATVAQ